jgi:DNA-binding NarL/FixJ family response regulator
MTAVQQAVRVLVSGPRDLVTTSVAPALRTHGFAATPHRTADPLPPVPAEGGVLVVNLDVSDGAALVAAATASGWRTVAVFRPSQPARAAAAVAAGATALLPRTASFRDLLDVIAAVVEGRDTMPADERAAWVNRYRAAMAEANTRRRRLGRLTERELDVLRRLERGQKAAEIAVDAVLALSTVRTHIRSILVKLEVNSQQQAIALYRGMLRRAD